MAQPKRRQRAWLMIAAAVLAAAVALAALLALGGGTSRTGTAPPSAGTSPVVTVDQNCDEGEPLQRTLSSGATWSMCWRIGPDRGLIIEDGHLTPPGRESISIFASLGLAQLEVPYDTGERTTYDITEQGFGGRNLQTLTPTECAGDLVRAYVPNYGEGKVGGGETRPVLCVDVVDDGVAYRSSTGGKLETARANALRISTTSKVGWYEYLNQYTFGADGSIRPELGATGDLSPEDYPSDDHHGWSVGEGHHDHAASHHHNAVWGIHWALGGHGNQRVEQYDADFTGERGQESLELTGELKPILRESARTAADRRWWRIVNPAVRNDDGHQISYQIDVSGADAYRPHGEDGVTTQPGYDVAFSEYNECERFASKNNIPPCTGSAVEDYVSDHQRLDDTVSWVAVSFHHVARDEDQSPMSMHWQGFRMQPRDLTAQRIDLPTSRASVNGRPR